MEYLDLKRQKKPSQLLNLDRLLLLLGLSKEQRLPLLLLNRNRQFFSGKRLNNKRQLLKLRLKNRNPSEISLSI
jgi:hypothetical protein